MLNNAGILSSDSSHTEDRPTVSECEFLDSDVGPEYMHQEYYLDRIMHWTRFRPTFTKAKRRLLLNLSRVMVGPQDNEKTVGAAFIFYLVFFICFYMSIVHA